MRWARTDVAAPALTLITRPAPDAQRWTAYLAAEHIAAVALPLIDIRPAGDQAALATMQADVARFQAVMFVSAAAVNHFFIANNSIPECQNGLKILINGSQRVWATGQGTVHALLDNGVPASRIDAPAQDAAQWDSESLWGQVQHQAPRLRQVLVVRGTDATGRTQGRDWLAQQLQAVGVQVSFALAYARHPPTWTPAEHELAARASHGLWVFSSSEAVAHLQHLRPGQSWATARALVTHPRIGQSAREAGFGVVYESRPGLATVAGSIKSLQ
ncbi:MAG: hypothetical protein RLZZ401_836 [Pseudomonadota bacterium]